MSENSGNKSRNDINRIRELIRKEAMPSGIPVQEGVQTSESPLQNVPKHKGPETRSPDL